MHDVAFIASDLERRVAVTVAKLRDAALAAGMLVSADGRVSEADAARLLHLRPATLAAKRKMDGPVPYGVGLGRARVSYRFEDLGLWLEMRRDPA